MENVINNILREDVDFKEKIQPSKKLKYPCSICNKSVMSNQKAIECDTCNLWSHIKCDGTSEKEYDKMIDDIEKGYTVVWHCLVCKIRENHTKLPFILISDNDYENLLESDSMKMLELLPRFQVLSEVSKISDLNSHDIDANISQNVNCKYYSVNNLNKLLQANKGDLSIFHSNMNGLETHFENLHTFLSSVPVHFDIINVTETSQKEDEAFKSNIAIEGYDAFFTPPKSNKGGTGIYIKEVYDSFERSDLSIIHKDYEATWIEIKNKKSKNIVSACIYRHPRSNMDEFHDYFEKCLDILSRENKEVYISGDFNTDLLKLEKNPSHDKFYNLMTSYGFLPQILDPSRVTGSSSTVIDNIYSNCLNYKLTSGNILISLSEHFSQFVSVSRNKPDFKSNNIYQRDYSKFCAELFRDDVSIQKWDNNLTNVNEQFNDFYWRLENCVDRHAPLKKINKEEQKLRSKPWITSQIKKIIKQRDKALKRLKRQPNNEDVKTLYKKFRNKVNREIKKSKKSYYKNYFEENKNNIKKTWNGIKSIINPNSNSISNKILQLNNNGQIIDDPQKVVSHVNNFFVNVGPNTDRVIPKVPPDKISPERFLKNRNQLTFIIAHISTEEITDIIKSLNASKSTGPSSIPTKLLLLIPDLIILPLCKIINNSFMTGIFPDALKIVKVIPIHKGNSTDDVNNYRPISLLSVFDKIIEKLMHKRLYKFLEDNQILYENQFGFRKQNSTVHALIQITEQIRQSIENGKYGCGIFIDLRKAFDTVNHDILLKKLEHYGVRGTPLQWFKSYLSNRKQYVFVNGYSSELKGISCGVPQGSVLGPLLFLIYINDLPNISKIFKFFLFADDTNIYYESDNLKQLERTVNKELQWLNHWLNVNRLSLNISKTNFVIFHPYNKPVRESITIKVNKKAISEVKYVKYLGILIDSNLSWKYHINNLVKKISRAIGVMYRVRPFVTKNIMMNLYYSLIYPHLLYAIQIWGSTFENYINKIVVLQKKLVRVMTFNVTFFTINGPPAHTAPLFKSLNILKFKDIFELRISQFIYECIHNHAPIQFNSWFVFINQVHSHSTRTNTIISNETDLSGNLFIPYVRTTHYGLKSIKVAGPKIWNKIPREIRTAISRFSFAKSYKKSRILHY